MRLLKKRETLVQNIAYMGIMTAINVIFVLLTYFIPFLLFVLVFILPLCSAIISFYCKKVYFPIYLIAVSAICLIIDLQDTIFYVIPSLITGFVFGLLIDKKVPPTFMVVAVSIIQFGLSLLSIPLIKLITGHDIVYDMAVIFKVQNYKYLDYFKYLFIFFVSFAQTFISYLVMHSELNKFGMQINEKLNRTYIIDVASIFCVILSIGFAFLVPFICYIFLFLAFIFMISRLFYLDYSHYRLYAIELAIIVIASIFFVALIYQYIAKPFGLLTLGIVPTLISFTYIINNCLLSKRNKDTIN